jgi:Fe/S biogenesis protein NfuA
MSTPILTITHVATLQVTKILQQEGLAEQVVRVGIQEKTPTGFTYQLEFVNADERAEGDHVIEQDGVRFYIDAKSAEDLRGTSLDYVDNGLSAGFKFENPNKPSLLQNPLAERVFRVIQDKINPGVASHGGHVTLLDVKDGTAYVQLGGGCQGCGQADTTVKEGIQTMICESVPEIHTVLDVTDHAAGENPYFQP